MALARLVLVAAILSSVISSTAGTTGSVTGFVYQNGSSTPLEGVSIEAVSRAQVVKTHTDHRGFFVFISLIPGRYHIVFRSDGFQVRSTCPFEVEADQRRAVIEHLYSQVTVLPGPCDHSVN
jgi:hypothetical protein